MILCKFVRYLSWICLIFPVLLGACCSREVENRYHMQPIHASFGRCLRWLPCVSWKYICLDKKLMFLFMVFFLRRGNGLTAKMELMGMTRQLNKRDCRRDAKTRWTFFHRTCSHFAYTLRYRSVTSNSQASVEETWLDVVWDKILPISQMSTSPSKWNTVWKFYPMEMTSQTSYFPMNVQLTLNIQLAVPFIKWENPVVLRVNQNILSR